MQKAARNPECPSGRAWFKGIQNHVDSIYPHRPLTIKMPASSPPAQNNPPATNSRADRTGDQLL